jgi:choline dehydrogenase-like flavoprotein
MARGRQSVCLLERGKEKWLGEYPSSLSDVMKELHVSGDVAAKVPTTQHPRFYLSPVLQWIIGY